MSPSCEGKFIKLSVGCHCLTLEVVKLCAKVCNVTESERERVHQVYDPSAELDGQEREMREITPGHFVLSTEAEAEEYKKALS